MLSSVSAKEYLDRYDFARSILARLKFHPSADHHEMAQQAVEMFYLQTDTQKTHRVSTRMWGCVIDAARLMFGRSLRSDEGTHKRPKYVTYKPDLDKTAWIDESDPHAARDVYKIYWKVEKQLTERQREVFNRLMLGQLQNEIATDLGITLSRVSQLRRQLLNTMRQHHHPTICI